jgi:signal transduction histidine kinase
MWEGYVLLFGLATATCFAALPRVRTLSDADTRRSLAELLVVGGLWGLVSLLQLLAPTFDAKLALYTVGQIMGLAAVGAWLAFVSAYTGVGYHRDRRLQTAALGVYLAAVVVKATNPLHGQYFTARLVDRPFPHLAVERLPLDWTVTVLAYLLAGVGFYLLYRLFADVDYRAERLAVLLALTALPIVPTFIPRPSTSLLLDVNYEPLSVAVFALGALYLSGETFVSVGHLGRIHTMDALDDVVLVLDTEDRLRRCNPAAVAAVPALAGARGRPLDALCPRLAAALTTDGVVELPVAGGVGFFLVKTSELRVGTVRVGSVVVATDVTEIERSRAELARQNGQLEEFAAAIDHELRNAAAVVAGHGELALSRLDAEEDEQLRCSLRAVRSGSSRMVDVVDDLTTLARFGQSVVSTQPCSLAAVGERAVRDGRYEDLSVHVATDGVVLADEVRLRELFAAAFDFSRINGATRVTVAADDEGFTVTDDGRPIEPDARQNAFTYGWATPSAETRMLLPLVRTLAAVHGWTVDLDPDHTGGVRLRFRGVARAGEVDARGGSGSTSSVAEGAE